MNRPQPSARGELRKTPLAHVLIYGIERRLAGTLEFVAPNNEYVQIVLVEGLISKVRTSEPVSPIGRLLVERGLITEDVFKALLEVAEIQREPLGKIAVRRKVVDQSQIDECLRFQVLLKVRHTFTLPEMTAYSFYSGVDLLEEYCEALQPAVDPFPALFRGICDMHPSSHVDAALSHLPGGMIRLVRGATLARFEFDSSVAAAVECLRAQPMTLDELCGLGLVTTRVARLLAYLLVITRQVEVRAGQAAPPQGTAAQGGVGGAPSVANVAGGPPPVPPRSQPMRAAVPVGGANAGVAGQNASSVASSHGASGPASTTGRSTFAGMASGGIPNVGPTRPASPHAPTSEVMPRSSTNQFSDSASTTDQGPPSTVAGKSGLKFSDLFDDEAAIAAASDDGVPPELRDRRDEIIRRCKKIDSEDFFSALGVAQNASVTEVKAAYFELVKKWHPDKLNPRLSAYREQCAHVFSRIGEAHKVLTDDEQRVRYMKLLREGGATPDEQETIAAVLEAASLFQRAEFFFKKGDIAQAEEYVRGAMSKDPKPLDYAALLAWIELAKQDNPGAQFISERLAVLDRAIEASPRGDRNFFFRGMLHKRLGKHEKAQSDFRKAVELNPRHVEAERELRIYEMRRSRSGALDDGAPPPSAKPKGDSQTMGFIGKLFKKA